MENKNQNLDELVRDFNDNYEKFNQGSKVAGTRARKALQQIKTQAQELRLSIQERKNNM